MESTDKPTPELEKTEDTLAPDLPSQTQEEPPKKFAQTSSQTDEEMLFSNRQNFLRFNRFKIDRNLITLSDIDRLIFLVIPRLLHVHQEGLPGYFEGDPPCGIYNFLLDKEAQIAAEKLFPDVIIRRNQSLKPVIHTALLMGSVGSIAQTVKSDLDYTLLVDKNDFTEESMKLFQKKLNLIETWTWDNYNLETHFFINDYEEVKNNIFGESDSESTGSALAKLLKEEMYRTMIIVTGKVPFWLISPVDCDDDRYYELYGKLLAGKTLLKKEEFIDMGNVDDISQGEFFGGSIWALIKSFKSPFKTLMKMGVLEDYMFGDTKSNLLCHQIKDKYYNDIPYLDIDPYLGMFERVQKFFLEEKSEDEADALRHAFYLKVGTQVTTEEFEKGSEDWKKSTLIKMLKEWGWNPEKIERLNNYSSWQMMHKVDLGNRINKILMASYKNISEKNKTLDPSESLITEKDTHLLGRKLFSFYRAAPNKVDNLGALVDGKTAENELTFLLEQKNPNEKPEWYLIRGQTRAYLEEIDKDSIIRKSSTLPFLLAFTVSNHLYSEKTEILLSANGGAIKENDLIALLKILKDFIESVNIAALSNEDLLNNAKITQLFLLVDFGNPPPPEISMGNIRDCKNNDELNKFINKRIERAKSITTIYLTSWGELFCKSYAGLNCMARCISDLSSQLDPDRVSEPEFLKVYIPSGRKEILQIPWLNNYIVRSLVIRATAHIAKNAS
ncbi:MAG: adenylate cyclase [Nitrospina sp.]|nr:adenylate cyclase [Nitrospina sp.]MBT6347364.1 adenylate cyclase [Nitrospina sp.]